MLPCRSPEKAFSVIFGPSRKESHRISLDSLLCFFLPYFNRTLGIMDTVSAQAEGLPCGHPIALWVTGLGSLGHSASCQLLSPVPFLGVSSDAVLFFMPQAQTVPCSFKVYGEGTFGLSLAGG